MPNATEEEETTEEIVSALERRSRSDYVALGTRIGVGSIPFVGGALIEFVTQFIPESKERRIAEFVAQLWTEFNAKRAVGFETDKTKCKGASRSG